MMKMLSSKNIDLPFRFLCLCITLFFSLGCHSEDASKQSTMAEYQEEKEEVMQRMDSLEKEMLESYEFIRGSTLILLCLLHFLSLEEWWNLIVVLLR